MRSRILASMMVILLSISASFCKADFIVDALAETSPTFPAGTPASDFDFASPPPTAFSESDDPLAPFRNESVYFDGRNRSDDEQRLDAFLVYRFQIQFEEDVFVEQITVGGAGDNELGGSNAVLRLLDQDRTEIATVPLTGFNVYRLHTLEAGGVRGRTFFLDEFDYSSNWRYRDHISIAFTSVGKPGDFDSDGDVDGGDFLIWQQGESPNPLSSTDVDEWQENFGSVVNSITVASTRVPEPSTSNHPI